MRVPTILTWGALLCVLTACATPRAAVQTAPLSPRLVAVAQAAKAAACGLMADLPPMPTPASHAPSGALGALYDVVVYTAHPDDESMYVGGTLDLLARAGRTTAVVIMSHGEGGQVLEPGPDGGLVSRRDRPRAYVARLRDREMALAARRGRVAVNHLYPAAANADFAFTTSCSETLERWDRDLPGGIAGVLRLLVDDLRVRRPRVVLTLDPRDDPGGSQHGHHRAIGVLVELAARLAADPGVPGASPHVIDELLAFGPKGAPYDVALEVDTEARLSMLRAHASQYLPRNLAGMGSRPEEHFVLRWRTVDHLEPPSSSVLEELLGPWADGSGAGSAATANPLIEILPVFLRGTGVSLLRASDVPSWRIPYVTTRHPNEVVSRWVSERGLAPQLVHSTSWRHKGGRLILTYLAVIDDPGDAAVGAEASPVTPGVVARGDDTLPPERIDVAAVLNHALEHLAWLLREDPAIRDVLPADWARILSPYAPKPFLAEP